MNGKHFFIEINGGQWHRTEDEGDFEVATCTCGVRTDDKRVLKRRPHDDDSWKYAPTESIAPCFPPEMRGVEPISSAFPVDAAVAAADRTMRLHAENEALKLKLAEHEVVLGHAIVNEDYMQQLIAGLREQLPPDTQMTVEGIVDAVAKMALQLDCHEDASTPAFDEIAKLCGCPTWEYPGQVVRDVMHVIAQRDGLQTELRDVMLARDKLQQVRNQLGNTALVQIEALTKRRDDLIALVARLSNESEERRMRVVQLEADTGWLRSAWQTEVAKNEELQANAVRMREYRFSMEGIATDGKGNPINKAEAAPYRGVFKQADEDVVLREKTARIDELVQQKDMAYSERDRCVAAIAALAVRLNWSVWLGRHEASDKSWDHDWRTIVFMNLPSGQVSWHIHDSELPWFDFVPMIPERPWDGHTTQQKYARLAKLGEKAEPYPPKPGCPDCGSNMDRVIRKAAEEALEPDSPSSIAYRGVYAIMGNDGEPEARRELYWNLLNAAKQLEVGSDMPEWAREGASSEQVRASIIAEVGMMAANRTPAMQAAYDAAVAREGWPKPVRGVDACAIDGHMFGTDDETVPCARCGLIRAATLPCACSEKYRELAPGVHAAYCPLKGLPLERAL